MCVVKQPRVAGIDQHGPTGGHPLARLCGREPGHRRPLVRRSDRRAVCRWWCRHCVTPSPLRQRFTSELRTRGPAGFPGNFFKIQFIHELSTVPGVARMPELAAVTLKVHLPQGAYFLCLRALGAWWRLGSSAIEPRFLTEYAPEPLTVIREAGLVKPPSQFKPFLLVEDSMSK